MEEVEGRADVEHHVVIPLLIETEQDGVTDRTPVTTGQCHHTCHSRTVSSHLSQQDSVITSVTARQDSVMSRNDMNVFYYRRM